MTDNWKPGDTVIITGYVYKFFEEVDPDMPVQFPQLRLDEHDFAPAGWVNQEKGKWRLLLSVTHAPQKAMILGWSTRQIGRVHPAVISPDNEYGPEEYEPAWLQIDKTFKVWYAMPLDPHQRNRYRKPVTALPEQIKDIE